MKETHDLVQGSPEWQAFRLTKFGASEAAAMLGLSKTTTRNELLRIKATGSPKVFSDWLQANVLDEGHRVEALARPIAEGLIGEDLYPVTMSEGRMSASCDGLTMIGDVAWENKQPSASLLERMYRLEFPEEHMPQCQQVLLCTGASRLLFTVSDGTPGGTVSMWVKPDPAWFKRLRAGWAQFEADLAAYVAPEVVEPVTAVPIEALPALSVRLDGALAVVSNLEPFGVALRAFVAKIPAKPSTDQEFADTEAACKALKQAEDRLQQAEDSALASMSDVETMRRLVADFRNVARTARLASEKMVTARKAQIREDEIARGRVATANHIQALNERLGKPYMPGIPVDFATAIKGLKTIDSLRNSIDTTIANFKIEANRVADRIQINAKALEAWSNKAQFPDAATLVLKDPDDLAAVIAQRVAETERRLEAERERIRAEEAARLEREAAVRAKAEAEAKDAKERQAAIAVISRTLGEPPHIDAEHAAVMQQVKADIETITRIKTVPFGIPAAHYADETATLKLGTICERLGFHVTEAFVRDKLGIKAAVSTGTAKLYYPSDWGRIRDALRTYLGELE